MRALVLDAEGPAFRADHPEVGRPGEARIEVRLAGVCATDLELCRGYMGFRGVLGHEFVGVVCEAPEPGWRGARVVGEINASCGACPTCRAGRRSHCPHRTVLGIAGRDGAFAERLWLPVENLHRVPDEVPDEAAVFVEPLAAALRILEQVEVGPGMRVAVLGLGRLGLLCARVLATTGAEVTGVARGARSRARLGAPCRAIDLDTFQREPPFDLLVEATGAPEGLALTAGRIRPGGTLVLKSTVQGERAAPLNSWVIDEIRVLGSRCGPFDRALRALAQGLVDPTDLIEAEHALDDGLLALRRAAGPGVGKVLLRPG